VVKKLIAHVSAIFLLPVFEKSAIFYSHERIKARPSALTPAFFWVVQASPFGSSALPPPKKNLPRISARLFGSRHLPLSMPFCKTTILKLNCLLVHLSSPAYEVHICSAACRRNISSRVDFSMNINRQPSLLPNCRKSFPVFLRFL